MMRTVKADKIRVCFNREDFRVIIWGNLLEFGDLGFWFLIISRSFF